MSWDKEHIRRLLDEVASTRGHASAAKSRELLNYVTGQSNLQDRAELPKVANDAKELESQRDGR